MKELRKKRLEEAMKRGLSSLIHRRRAKDDRFGLVSISGVDLNSDFSAMTARVSCFGSDEENRNTLRALKDHSGFFQSNLSRSLHLRQTPILTFIEDDNVKKGDTMLEILEQDEH